MLCRLCRDIFSGDIRPVDKSSVFHSGHHHISLASLESSISSGCWICKTLAAEFKEKWATKCSIEYIFIASRQPQDADEDEGDLHLTFFLVYGYEPRSMLYLKGSSIVAKLRFWMSPRSSSDDIVSSSHISTFDADSTEYLEDFSESTGSEKSLLLAHKWLEECCNTHDFCSSNGIDAPSKNSKIPYIWRPWYPTRLLDVGLPSPSHIRLIHSRDTLLDGPYVALSHCWGGKIPLRLLESNITALQTSIALNDLPRTFADAVTVARKLEVRYLWIDSLCIIQDSTDDWNHQALQMCNVYRRCLLCIVAGAAANSTEGLFKRREPSACVTSQIIQADWKGRSPEKYLLVDLEFWRKNVIRSPINSRAWVLQERLLSPIVLRFEKEQVFWECLCSSKCESFPNGIPSKRNFHTPADSVPRRLLREGEMRDHEDEEIDFNHMWYRIVSDYSQATLTRPEDKLIAISGLAKAMRPLVDDSYVAGMWRKDLLACIPWKAVKRQQNQILPPKPSAYRAPSWSWAAVDTETSLQHLYDAKRLIGIRSCNVVSQLGDPFGQIVNGSLTISGALVAVVVHHDFGYAACRVVDWETAATEASKKLDKQNPLKVNILKRWTSLKHLATCWTGNSNNMTVNLDEPADAKEFMAFLLPVEKTEWLIRGLVLLPAGDTSERGVYIRKGMFEANLDSSEFLESTPKMTPSRQLLYQDYDKLMITIK